MIGLGTLINTGAVIVGGVIGLFFGKLIGKRLQTALITACGVSTLFIGIGGVLEKMLVYDNGKFSTQGMLMMIICMALGTLIGELINIDKGMEKLGDWLKAKTAKKSADDNTAEDATFTQGFLTASITFCVGAMTIIGSIEDGIYGDYSILLAKSVLDFIMVIVLTSTLGKGCIFSAIPVFVIQSLFTLLGYFIGPILSDGALNNLSYVGSVLIFCVGLNLLFPNKVKVANMLPAVLLAVAYAYLPI
ncbi:MAG: DUF554 domain-containing protein [Clostridia bacterium]|nr:DUF554 domain-containing protein [Clostridia bacterium]